MARRVNADARNWSDEYKTIEKELAHLLIDSPAPEDIDGVRIKSERLALWVSRLAWTQSRDAAVRAARLALSALEEVWDGAFSERLKLEPVDEPWSLVQSQVTLNTLILVFWWRELFGSIDLRLGERAPICLDYTERKTTPTSPHRLFLPTYPALARFAMSSDKEERAVLGRRLIDQIDQVIERDEASGYAFDLSSVDKIECHRIKDILRDELSG